MANKQLIGLPVPFGTAAGRITTWTSGGSALSGVVSQLLSFNVRQNIAIADLKDGDMNTIGRAGHDETHEMTLEVIVYDTATGTEAASRLKQNLPDKMSIVTVGSNAVGPSGRSPNLIDGDWNYVGGSYNGAQGDYHKYSLTVWRGGTGSNPDKMALVS